MRSSHGVCGGLCVLLGLSLGGLLAGCEDEVNLGDIRSVAVLGQDWDNDSVVEPLPVDPSGAADHLVDFGQVVVRQRATRVVVLGNDATARDELIWTSITLESGSSGDFSLELPPGNDLPPGQATFFTVVYLPAEDGADSGAVLVETNDPERPTVRVSLGGEGVSPDVQVCLLAGGVEQCNDQVAPQNLSVDFGRNDLDQPVSRQFLVRNVGVFALTLQASGGQGGVDFSAGTSEEYALDTGPWTGTLAPGAERTFEVTFTPIDGGVEAGSIEVTSTDPDETVVVISLTGSGIAPKICPEPPFVVDFGSVSVGTTANKPYRFSSCGTEVLTVTALELQPGPEGYFSFSTGVTTPLDLPPGATFDVLLAYAPQDIGSHQGQLTIRSNDPNGGEGWIALRGRATPIPTCDIEVSPTAVDFGQVSTSGFATRTVSIVNVGDAECTVSGIQGPVGDAGFSLTGLPGLPMTVPIGELRQFSVRYQPPGEGSHQATVTVVCDNDPDEPGTDVSLVGTGVQPPPCDFQADPSVLNFGSVPMGQPVDLVTRVHNFGSESCTLWDWGLVSGSSPSFTPSAAPFPRPEVDPGQSYDITVTFNPQSDGLQTGTLEIKGGEDPFHLQRVNVALTGGGEAARMCLNPEVLDFGPVNVGQSRTMSFTITACGPGNLRVRQIAFDGGNPDFTFAAVPGAPRTIPAGQSHTVTVQYSPSAPGADFGRVIISGNDDLSPNGVVELKGNYTGTCPAVFACEPTGLGFGLVELGRSAELAFTCTNHGSEALTVSAVALGPGTSPEFGLLAPGLPLPVPPGGNLFVEVAFTPADLGVEVGSVAVTSQFTSEGCDNFTLISVALEAEGVTPDLPPCITPRVFQPTLEFEWPNGSISSPSFKQVFMTPVVINLTDDNGDGFINEQDIPDIVFNSFAGGLSVKEPAIIRAISGDDGRTLFSIDDPRFRTNFETQLAVGDIDGDNLPEILASKLVITESGDIHGQFVTGNLLCFEHDGTFKWESEPWHAPEDDIEDGSAIGIADLDHDGHPEIFRGPSVFNRHGQLLWEGTAGRGGAGHGVFCTAADLDRQGGMELVCGNTAYRADGTVMWQVAKDDGFVGIADFNLDGQAEVILFSIGLRGGTFILNGQTGAILSTLNNSEVSAILNPVIADIDGSGGPEVAVVGTCQVQGPDGMESGECFWGIEVNEANLAMSVLWKEEIYDSTLGGGNSGFDFEGDGPVEVIQNDERWLNVYSGLAHNLIYQAERWSVTGWEHPVVVDVDNDGHAEMITIQNGLGMSGGILVYGNAEDDWVSTRRVWNQFEFHVTNVRENGTIPRFEVPNWTVYNNANVNEPFCD